MRDNDLARIARAVAHLEARQRGELQAKFGDRDRFRHGMAYHNLDHGVDVANGAEAKAQRLVSEGVLPLWAPVLSRIAGIFHDHVQDAGPGRNEDLSVEAALAAMGEYEELDRPEFKQAVAEGIDGTKVLRFAEGRIFQNATADRPFAAVTADGDLSTLSSRSGARQVLGLHVEIGRHKLDLPEWTNLRDVQVDADALAEAIATREADFRRNHEYVLNPEESRARLAEEADYLADLGRRWQAGELSWHDVIDETDVRALTQPVVESPRPQSAPAWQEREVVTLRTLPEEAVEVALPTVAETPEVAEVPEAPEVPEVITPIEIQYDPEWRFDEDFGF